MIVGISGKLQTGKDTIGKIIQYLIHESTTKPIISIHEYLEDWDKEYDIYDWQIKKFADRIKDITCMLIGCTRKQLEDEVFKNTELGKEWTTHYCKGVYKDMTGKYNKRITPLFASTAEAFAYKDGWKATSLSLANSLMITETLTPRKLLQLIGTECGRDIIHPDIWVNATMAEYKPKRSVHNAAGVYTDVNPNWAITDVRFPNEVKAIKDRGGIIIKVNRKSIEHNMPLSWYEGLHEQNMLSGDIEFIRRSFHPSETALDNYKEFDYIIDNHSTIESLMDKVKEVLIKEKLL